MTDRTVIGTARSNALAIATALATVLSLSPPVAAQSARPVLSGESGVFAESYGIDGRAARRPTQSARFYASPTLSWLGMEIGTNLMWSTEDAFTAQTMQRLYLNPRWSWGEVHAGDYTPAMSRFTATAVRIRGGGVDLTPGRFRVAAAGGLAQDATDRSAFDAAPRRVIYAGLVGYGEPTGAFIELSALRAADDSAGTDSLSVAPQENVVGALAAGVTLGRVRLRTEVGASAFSRDIRASELDSTSQPAAGGVFTPRLSSRVDGAYSLEARLALGNGSVAVLAEQIGPGFTSLGNPYLANDRREGRLSANLRLFRNRLSTAASVGLRHDNLANDKRGTTRRRTGSFMATLVGGPRSVTSVGLMMNGLTLSPAPLPPGTPDPGAIDSFRLRNITLAVTALQQLRFGSHTISLAMAAQDMNDESPRFGDVLDARSSSVNLDWTVAIRQMQFSLRPGHQRFSANGVDDAFTSAGWSLARRVPRSAWNASVAGTWTEVQEGRQWRHDASFGVRITARDQLSMQARHTSVSGVAEPFTEFVGSMRLTRRW